MSVYFVNAETNEVEQKPETHTTCSDDQSQTQSEAQAALLQFWPKITEEIKQIRTMDLKQQALPLARIKKIMKLDEDVKMISAEAPMLFAKAAEIFIHELTLRSWIHTEDNKRRTLQRNDIAMAITKFDQFDFLIDIVPRDDIKPSKPKEETSKVNPDQVQYYFQLAQQHHANLQQNTTATATATPQGTIQVVQQQQQQQQQQQPQTTIQAVHVSPAIEATTPPSPSSGGQATVMIQSQQQQQVQTSPTSAASQAGLQIVQQIVTPSGEVQQIPIQLSPQQLQLIRMQLQGNSSQPIIIQAAPIQAAAQPQLIQVQQNAATPAAVFLTQANGSTDTE
ncbi:PREDICTED: nuclear transcription factor Y subunit gamma [Nicrophorus vespilloides]|uniref:Nuclear transcription factor Y subunit gamma n=1 Tax=Nicrophorus vespilloides TaxID=110193 RepID=A0ABM1MRZ5_NICVS|nr:PREDICTED: nuclear transcription factor Y subunit gamma [Nicrophorus vespilloides]